MQANKIKPKMIYGQITISGLVLQSKVLSLKTWGIVKRGDKIFLRNYKRELKNGQGMNIFSAIRQMQSMNELFLTRKMIKQLYPGKELL